MTPRDHSSLTVDALAQTLNEPNTPLLTQVLHLLGPERTTAVLADTLTCEAAGGMLTVDGRRRRTPGGVFFQLVRRAATPQERAVLFPPAASRPLTWEGLGALLPSLATTPAGDASMKVTLVGRPSGPVTTEGAAVLFRLKAKPPGPLPKGLPFVPKDALITWQVVVALRQWNRVKDSLRTDPEDQLVLEGYACQQGTALVVLVQKCTSVLQQRAQKQAQRSVAAPQQAGADTPAVTG